MKCGKSAGATLETKRDLVSGLARGPVCGTKARFPATNSASSSDCPILTTTRFGFLVIPEGPACHTGAQSCFHNKLQDAPGEWRSEKPSKFGRDGRHCLRARRNPANAKAPLALNNNLPVWTRASTKILKKVGEEICETIIAAKNEIPCRWFEETF